MTSPSASMEDYMEAIMVLNQGGRGVRVTEVSKALGVTKPSVTAALKKLTQEGLVRHERYGYVELTAEGNTVAENVFRRHEILRHFLTEVLNIDPRIAAEDACEMEHHLSPITVDRLGIFVDFIINRPKEKNHLSQIYNYYFKHGTFPENSFV